MVVRDMPPTESKDMDDSREQINGFLPAGVAQVPKEELQRYLKCKRIGNYLLGKTIGEGSFARVKQGFHVLTGEKVAVKIIDKKQAHQDKYVARNMRREAKIMQMIRHPNIVQLLEVVETEHRYYLVTELAAGGDLMDYICYRRKLGEVEVRKFIRQTVSAVHYLHQGGILHRDLKVENLLLDDDYNIKIIDFGLSNTLFVSSPDGQSTKEHLKTQCGSPAYAAPEILGHKPYGPEVDVWSIGVNMYAMLTGKLPYTAEPFHITTLYNKMKRNEMNPIPDHLSSSCKDLIQRFLTFDREERITLEDALGHEWLQKGFDGPLIPIMFPNYPRDEELDKNILRHMVGKMDLKHQEIVEAVTQNRSTPTSTVYHLLQRKLRRYYSKHPNKAERTMNDVTRNTESMKNNSESVTNNSESVRNSRGSSQDKENKRAIKKRAECKVATVKACDLNDKEESTSDEAGLEREKVSVPAGRKELISHSQENLSKLDGELTENASSLQDDLISEKLESETDRNASDEQKDRTCSVLCDAGIEISRKTSCNYSSVEVAGVNGRKLSMNLSHILIESKATVDKESTGYNEQERKENTVNSRLGSPRRVIETKPAGPQERSSPRHSRANPPSVGKVSLKNAKIISIPLQQMKLDSPDKVNFNHRRFSLPHSYFPSRNPGANQPRQPVPSPFHFNTPPFYTEAKRKTKDSPSLPPYGLCCQLTAIKAQDEKDELTSRANEDRTRDHAQYNAPDTRHAQNWRNIFYSPSTDKRLPNQRHSIATTGGKELLQSINNTLGRLVEIQDKTELSKTPESLLLRSRLPLTTLNSPLKHEASTEGVKLSLIQEHGERAKERRNSPLKISCSVKDTHSPKPPSRSSSTGVLNLESSSTKEQANREKQTRGGQAERGAKRRRRRTLEIKIPPETNDSILPSKHEEGTCSKRGHSRDNNNDPMHDGNDAHSGRGSRDSFEEVI